MGIMGVGSKGGYLRSSPVSILRCTLGAWMARRALCVSPGLSLGLLGPHFFLCGTWGSLYISYALGTDWVRPGHP